MTIAFVDVEIFGNSYHIKCPEDKIEALQTTADYLEGKMQEIRQANPSAGLDRIAIIAALNIVHQLLFQEQESEHVGYVNQRLQNLLNKVDVALAKHSQLELCPTD